MKEFHEITGAVLKKISEAMISFLITSHFILYLKLTKISLSILKMLNSI